MIELYLSKTTPSGKVAADGTFVLHLHAYDRQGGGYVGSWRLIWAGREAETFWDVHRGHLHPGTPIEVTYGLTRIIDSKARFGGAEVMASVNSLHLPVIAANPNQKTTTRHTCSARAASVAHS